MVHIPGRNEESIRVEIEALAVGLKNQMAARQALQFVRQRNKDRSIG
jgi:hypothetical protein